MDLSCYNITEDGFSLEFLRIIDGIEKRTQMLGKDGFLVYERIVAPPSQVRIISEILIAERQTGGHVQPLVFTGSDDWPVQYLGIIARPTNEHTLIRAINENILLSTNDIQILFGGPAYSGNKCSTSAFSAMFRNISQALFEADMKETNLVRTWLFMRDISSNYCLLNEARNKYFSKWFPDPNYILPASTGIQGITNCDSHLMVQFLAVSGNNCSIERVVSPLQCEPTKYGVMFSRALCILLPLHKLMLISGTASVNRHGKTIHATDCKAQMMHALKTIKAILHQQGGSFSDIIQATIYIKNKSDFEAVMKVLKNTPFPYEKSIVQIADICRDDLLCEIEAIAVVPNN